MENLQKLQQKLTGELHYDNLMRTLYATDASVYKMLPKAVALPKTVEDIKVLINYARENKTSLIPRTAGTSLAGQCVGDGIVVDVSKHFTEILEINTEENWVRVQPGVIRDELNDFLKPYGFFFGPNTSTANRCMIGGMVGNNSCGSTSIVYGSTRDHTLELKTILSDGSEVIFKPLNEVEFDNKLKIKGLEGNIYRFINKELSDKTQAKRIQKEFPKKSIRRRNTGYAVDLLLDAIPFSNDGEAFNFCKLLAGSEGTLAFTTEIKLNISSLQAPEVVVVAPHFKSIRETTKAVLTAMKHEPTACEMMDDLILQLTKGNIEQQKNRFFVEGDPAGMLMIEFRGQTLAEAEAKAEAMIADMKANGEGYAFPKIYGKETNKVWTLRSAGLGILANIPGDPKAVACIEDTAVALEDLPDYIDEFSAMMEKFEQQAVYYAHAGDGELHLRPVLNLKKAKDIQLFHDITEETAKLVKKYNGSLSGEHGDGRVRAEFIPLMVGQENYELFKRIKTNWDENGIFNPGKIVDAEPMNTNLRYEPEQETAQFDTIFDFDKEGGILRLAEKCNGSGDCRKTALSGGTMCPSYRATRNEKETTRARANTLRTFLTQNAKENAFNHPEIKEVMDLCLSCKGCTSECPSNVDMSTMKAEFLYQYQKTNGVPLRSWAFANIAMLNGLGSLVPSVTNFFLTNSVTSGIMKKILNVAPKRTLPTLHKTTLRRWFNKNEPKPNGKIISSVYLFCDEFTNFNDTEIGITAVKLLTKLGYEVKMVKHEESGRAAISKGLLDMAQKFAKANVAIFKDIITKETPLLGIEPSAILSFRDEYPRLVEKSEQEAARNLGKNALLIDEFIAQEIEKGNITSAQFTTEKRHVKLHGHCHQKALSSVEKTAWLLGLPENYTVEIIPSGCCGMAGSFGYEAEHYEVSMNVGEDVLFPAVRESTEDTIIVAMGTSCRHQVKDGTGRSGKHSVEVLWEGIL
jgi:FAD/FMN-containing dehydrogenase/Fe-S oxidoreductase